MSPGQPTTFLFDSDLRVNGLMLENRERFTVAPVERILTLVPSERMRGEAPSRLTVCFVDDDSPACATFRLVIHPAIGERQVDVFRHPRPVESLAAELRTTHEENVRLRAANKLLRENGDKWEGLTGPLASRAVGEMAMPFQFVSKHTTENENNTLALLMAQAIRTADQFSIRLSLENPKGAKPWTPRGVNLIGPRGEHLEVAIWPTEPMLPEEKHYLWIEGVFPNAWANEPFTLKIWEADNQRTFVIGNIAFPALKQ